MISAWRPLSQAESRAHTTITLRHGFGLLTRMYNIRTRGVIMSPPDDGIFQKDVLLPFILHVQNEA